MKCPKCRIGKLKYFKTYAGLKLTGIWRCTDPNCLQRISMHWLWTPVLELQTLYNMDVEKEVIKITIEEILKELSSQAAVETDSSVSESMEKTIPVEINNDAHVS